MKSRGARTGRDRLLPGLLRRASKSKRRAPEVSPGRGEGHDQRRFAKSGGERSRAFLHHRLLHRLRILRSPGPGLFRGFPSGRYVVIRPSRDEKERAAVLVAYQIIFEPNAPGPCIVDTLDPENTPDELKDRSAKGGVEL